jgi:polyphosphate kinase
MTEQESGPDPPDPPGSEGGDDDTAADVAAGHARYDGAAPVPAGEVDLSDPAYYLNRELSELAFHRRVLHEALDGRTPLLERVKFLGIVTGNIDEFCMKRIGGLKEQIEADVAERSPDGRTPREQWTAALGTAAAILDRATACWREDLRPALADAGVHVRDHHDLPESERAALRAYFEDAVLPTLTPLTFDGRRSFPFLSNLSLSLAVRTREGEGEPRFSRVKIPGNRPRLVDVDEACRTYGASEGADRRAVDAGGSADAGTPASPEGRTARFVRLESVIAANLDLLFPNVEVVDCAPFRVTRNAEVRRNEDVAEGLVQSIEGVIRDRRFATVVRLEVGAGMDEATRRLLLDQLDLDERELFEREGPLDLRDLSRLVDLDRPELKPPAWQPQPHPRLRDAEEEVFATVRNRDVLVHHPYHSFEGTVQSFLRTAAHDEDVLAIKCAIYRTARDSQVVEALIEAARNGKQVAVMVELQARFDEENNLRWVRRLEEEGVHVAYGTAGLKAHAKCALVVRDESGDPDDGDATGGASPHEVRLYSHVGTGNYHTGTAKLYADLGLLTADRRVGNDLVRLFNFFTGHSRAADYERLLVAPTGLRDRLTERIREEAEAARNGEDARIVAKLNALEDPAMVRELYEASMAGVEIDLVVRGICRLRPGIDGVSDTVTVRSVVGRFLEHSRIYYFEHGGVYIGSADWMTRNLDRRVEAVVPIEDPDHRRELATVLDLLLADDRRAWKMDASGDYHQCRPADPEVPIDTHAVLMERARAATGDREPDVPAFPRDVRAALDGE